MCRPRLKLTLMRVGTVHAHAVDGDVGDARLGVLPAQQGQVEEGAGVLGRALDGGMSVRRSKGGLNTTSWQGAVRGRRPPVGRSFQGREQVEGQPFR